MFKKKKKEKVSGTTEICLIVRQHKKLQKSQTGCQFVFAIHEEMLYL